MNKGSKKHLGFYIAIAGVVVMFSSFMLPGDSLHALAASIGILGWLLVAVGAVIHYWHFFPDLQKK